MDKDKKREYCKKWRAENAARLKEYRDSRREETKEYNRQYYLKNREKEIARKTEYQKAYSKTPMGRAQRQIQQYKFMDRRNGFGDAIDFDARWIVENIYTKKCTHCDETDWHKLGCNRLDNNKPHTIDNVEPCCFHCNCVLNGIESGDRIVQWAKDNLSGVKRPDVSEKMKGRKRPDISMSLKGRTLSEEHKKKISESLKQFYRDGN